MNKKILIVNNDAWTTTRHRLGIISFLKDKGYTVKALSNRENADIALIDSICPFIELKYLKNHSLNPIRELRLVWELYRIYKKEKPDLILHYTIKPNIYGNFVARLLGVPAISTVNGLGRTFSKSDALNTLVKLLYQKSLKTAKKVFFQNSEDKQLFLDSGLVKSSQTVVVPGSGVNVAYYKPQSRHASMGKFRFLLASRLVWEKGIKEYVQASRIIKKHSQNVEFKLLGPHTDKLGKSDVPQDLIDEWQKEGLIIYDGVSNCMREEIAIADVIVLPGYYREGIPKILLEALSMGKPIITTNCVGSRETVIHLKNGLVVPMQNSNALAQAFLHMIETSRAQLEEMGENSRKLALEQFDEQLVFDKYLDIIKSIIHSVSPSRSHLPVVEQVVEPMRTLNQ